VRARRWWAWPLVPVYAAGLAVKDGLRRMGVLRTRRLAWPVVSVGSLSAGGAGKTPVVIALAELLKAGGWHVDVLSRGYGRDSSDDRLKDLAAQVVPDVEDATDRFGDEPTLIAQKTGVPVWVSSNRFFAGKSAESVATEESWTFVSETVVEVNEAEPVRGVHLLDDGFQHRGLGRAVDVVLVTAEDLRDALLPAGNRREGLRALRRADVVVVREEEWAEVEGRVRRWMRGNAAVWSVRRKLTFSDEGGESESQRARRKGESTEDSSEGVVAAWPDGLRVVGFCAIARPEGFWEMLAAAGCEVVGRVEFGDHHRYGMVDVERLVKVAGECGADGFITTEKDAVKLTVAMRGRLEAVGPLVIARLDALFVDEAEVVRELEERLG
jgi:tetraacyldisaccharide 4'-kinase